MARLPLSPMKDIAKGAGAARVSVEAADYLREILEDFARRISKKAWGIAQHSGRKTIKRGDFKIAYEQIAK